MWDQRYDTDEYVYGTTPNDFLADVAGTLPRGRTLCLAEGEGRNAVFLAELGHEVVAIDASAVGLEKARRLADSRGVGIKTVVADLEGFDIEPGGWDVIVSIFCHLPPETRKRLHRKVVNGLRPGGVFVLEAYRPGQLRLGTGGPRSEDLMVSLDALKEELKGLGFERGVETEREVLEGRYHTGKGAVVQVIAFKP